MMRKLMVNLSEAKIVLERDQFTFVRRVFARGCSAIEAAEKAFAIGSRYRVEEPMYRATDPQGALAWLYAADPRKDGYSKGVSSVPRYEIKRYGSRCVVEVVAIGKPINQQKWATVAHIDVTFKKVEQ